MSNYITPAGTFTPAVKTSVTPIVISVQAIIGPITTPLSPEQEAKMSSVGIVRSAEITAIYERIIEVHPELLPEGWTVAKFGALMQEGTDIVATQEMFLGLAANCGGIAKIVENNLLYICNGTMDRAKISAKTSKPMDLIVKGISTDFHGKTNVKKVATEFSIAPAGIVTITGVETGKMFTNHGFTILSILVANGLISETIISNPGSGFYIPSKWTKIAVTNVSATIEGKFSLFMQG